MGRIQAGVSVLTTLLVCGGTALAQGPAPDAQVYELTENAKLIAQGSSEGEKATSQILGWANPGTPLCPEYSARPILARPGKTGCTFNVTASDLVNLTTGLGTIQGRFTLLEPEPAAVDAPEFIVMRGNLRGRMDFSPALVYRLPFGTVAGTFTSDQGSRVPFFGVFVLPFACGAAKGHEVDCYLTYRLGDDLTSVIPDGLTPVADNERAVGYPTVRFDIYFRP